MGKQKAALEDALDSTVLGDLWFERGELREARHEHLRALKIRTARLPAGHPDVAESLESLGNVAIREVKGLVVGFVCFWRFGGGGVAEVVQVLSAVNAMMVAIVSSQ